MDPNERPFVCSWEGCKKQFTNEDHLNVHMKKHNLALCVTTSSDCQSISGADQTPTPTRFIRNCEELGLFQDLQNVNPFEETFRKANEIGKCGLGVPSENSEDTLHTPRVILHIKQENIAQNERSATSTAKNNEIKGEADQVFQSPVSDNSPDSIILGKKKDKNENVHVDIRTAGTADVVITTIKRKRIKKNKYERYQYYSDSSDSSEDKLQIVTTTNLHPPSKIRIERQREINREAQIRSRAKKKYMFEKVLNEVDQLKREKKSLLQDNKKLMSKVATLSSILYYHKDCPASKDPIIKQKVENLIKATNERIKERSDITNNNKPYKRILPNNGRCFSVPISPLFCHMNSVSSLRNGSKVTTVSQANKSNEDTSHHTDNNTGSNTSSNSSITPPVNIFTYGPPLFLHMPLKNSIMSNITSSTLKRSAELRSLTKPPPKVLIVEPQIIKESPKKIDGVKEEHKDQTDNNI